VKKDDAKIEELAAQYGVVLDDDVPPVREFFVAPLLSDASADGRLSYKLCQGYSNCPLLRNGRLWLCAPAAFSDLLCEHYGIDGEEFELTARDSFTIWRDATPAAGWEALNFLLHASPWCAHCDYVNFHFFPWESKPHAELSDWLE
jgi:hypothetical protein